MTHPLIAIVEDEEHLAQGLIFNLEAEGYTTHHEADGDSALAWLLTAEPQPAAVLLDVMLPGRDGFSILETMRAAGRYTPVLLLTARGRNEDILQGFAAGADDYLPKPFDLNILLARLSGLLRRMQWQNSSAETRSGPFTPGSPPSPGGPFMGSTWPVSGELQRPDQHYILGSRIIDFDALEIRTPAAADEPARTIHLTLMEADLLHYLLDRPGKIISRKDLLENVWRVHEDTDTRAIDNFIVRLRRYLEPDPTRPAHLLTVRGVGYRFVPGP